MNNSFELADQTTSVSVDSSASSSGAPPSPAGPLVADAREFELDCSSFDGFSPSASSCASSVGSSPSVDSSSSSSLKRERRTSAGLSRSQCVHNLSALCSTSSMDGALAARRVSPYEPTPDAGAGWGYFVDTPSFDAPSR